MPIYPKEWRPRRLGHKIVPNIEGVPFDMTKLRDSVLFLLQDITKDHLESIREHGTDLYALAVLEIVSGAAGIHQAEEAIEALELDIEETAENEPWLTLWEIIEEKTREISDKIDEVIDLPGLFTFDHNYPDGSYWLYYIFDKKDHPELF